MKKRFLSIALTLCMLLSIVPLTPVVATAETVKANYKNLLPGKLCVDGVDLVNGNDSHEITCSGGGTAKYDPYTQTLTLTNAKITGHTSQAMAAAGIYISDFSSDVKINLVGKNSITLTDTSFNNSGIFMWSSDNKAKLLIDGTGSLDIKLYGGNTSVGLNNTNSDIKVGAVSLSFENASTTKIIHTMFHTNASIVLDGTTITSTGGYLTGITTPDDRSKNSITIKDAEIDLKNTEGGIYTGNLTITNSKVTTYGDELATICCWGNISITDSTVYANTTEDFGIYCFGTATFSGGKATVISQESDGMKANSGLVIKNGAEVTVTSNEYTAVFTNETVNIENGKLTATGGENGYAILARRLVDYPANAAPTDSKTTITFGKDIMEVNGAIVETDDWDYTTVWDDAQDDEVDYWMTQSYFTDGNGNALSSAVIETAFVVTYTDGKDGETFADQSYIVPLGGSTPAFVGDLSDISGWTLKEWSPNVASTVTSTVTYTAQWKDIAAPTGKITLGKNSWKTFLDNITFGLFFKDTEEVTIAATDNSGENVKIEYLLSNKELTAEELATATFTAYSDKFTIEPNNEYVIYAKLSDKTGNVAYINSNGIVLDNVAPVISGIVNGETYCAAQTVTVSDKYEVTVTVNDEPVTLTNGQFTLSPTEGTQKIVAKDQAGNISAEMIVTVNDGHEGGTATCTKKAECKHCGNEYGEVDKNNHTTLTHVEAKAATTEAEGNIEYWHCEDCNKYFSDKDGKNEITLADTVTAKIVTPKTDDTDVSNKNDAVTSIDNAENSNTDVGDKSPKTVDGTCVVLWLVLVIISNFALGTTYAELKKRNAK